MNGKIMTLFDSYDAGYFDLSSELLAQRRGLEHLQRTWPVAPPMLEDAREKYVVALIEAARDGRAAPTLSSYGKARALRERWQLQSDLHAEAITRATEQLRVPQRLIPDYLRPALDAVVQDLGELSALLPPDPDDAQMARPDVSAEGREAWHRLGCLAVRYSAIRQAQNLVSGPSHPDDGEFSELANLQQLWPAWRNRRSLTTIRPPWPDEPRQRLVWLYKNGADFVVLTVDEREALHEQAYGAERERLARSARAARGMIGGGGV